MKRVGLKFYSTACSKPSAKRARPMWAGILNSASADPEVRDWTCWDWNWMSKRATQAARAAAGIGMNCGESDVGAPR